jgi:sRNA-binding protein
MKTQFTQEQINEVMEKRGGTRKAALRWLNRNATKQAKGKTAPTRDFKSAAANDKTEAKPEVKLPAKNASLVAKGAAYHVLAGRPSKDVVVACFGKSGYALSWVSRAERLGVAPQELCEQFRTNVAQVKQQWAALAEAK